MNNQKKSPKNRKTSNLWQNKNTGRWHYEVEFKRHDGTAFRKAGSRSSERDALAARDKVFADFNTSEGRASGKTLRSWIEYCFSSGLTTSKAETTLYGYQKVLEKHLIPVLGGTPLGDLTSEQIQLFSKCQMEKLGFDTAVKTHSALSCCLSLAVLQNVLPNNVAKGVKLTRPSAKPLQDHEDEIADKRILTSEEQSALLEAAKGTVIEPAIYLGLKLGLRMGETLGLKWSQVNFEANEIRIRSQLKYVPVKGCFLKPTKTRAGMRTLPMPNSLKAYLQDLKAKAEETGTEWVVVGENGKHLDPRNASRSFKAVAKKTVIGKKRDGTPIFLNGQPGTKNATHHSCRATFLSFMANQANNGKGISSSCLLKVAGHTKIETTQRYYIRTTGEDINRAISFID